MFRNTRLPTVVVLLIALAAILGLACPRAQAKPVPFKISGGGPAPDGLSLFGAPSPHEATGTATHLGKYSGEGHAIVDDFPTANDFHGSFVFVAANGDKLGCTYKGTYELSGAIDETVVVFNTGAAQKYLEAFPFELPLLDKNRSFSEQYAAQADA